MRNMERKSNEKERDVEKSIEGRGVIEAGGACACSSRYDAYATGSDTLR